ncbi:sulfide dehydrogenase (flavocytochrome), flavoprotein subunit [Sulfuricella denitrificans skB26]|uniref:Sulfide dehydrogenase (Flavocytochrome), flavoprotein subunit n=1 Tax=Sulfuricella denitrificans (strain DSM 22764 / NBRC 105220 / skB26) TaxID=1163617 RepID=S6AEN0_SULDS|nr:FCSD flavin-binding domain-containing protein [Sulfuricella denitrificans]BAN34231.1 sulfide dehydrogenase (flavocytochrome), flavoprotein subunit [Sulfuricella denitrificans skB26]
MSNMDRRSFIKLLGAATGVGLAGAPFITSAAEMLPKKGRRVVVIGGGYGGSIVAKYIRINDPSIEVVMIERDKKFVSCPFSNTVIGGFRDIKDNTITYENLAANNGIKVVYDEVTAVDTSAKKVVVSGGTISYDRLVLSPGIDFRFEEIEGYDPVATPKVIPHAWKAGEQTLLLRKQLVDLPKGGTVVMSIPVTPFRCPPGPYERISMMAWHLKNHNPTAKIIVLDANPDIVSKGPLFKKAWAKHYEGMIDYRPGNKVTKVDNKKRSVDTGVEEIKGDLVNLVPPQKAGMIAHKAGVVGEDKKWCPVNQLSFESTLAKDVHIIGDSCMAGAMPKSGYSANSQAKVCATNIVQLMNGQDLIDPSHTNVCYSYVTENEAISVAAVYKVAEGKTIAVANSGGVSPDLSELEAIYARSWIKNILHEMSS